MIFQPGSQEAGTLGMVLTSDSVDRWLLTCHHVVTRKDRALVAVDVILQPDAAGGSIGDLSNVRADASLDCAT